MVNILNFSVNRKRLASAIVALTLALGSVYSLSKDLRDGDAIPSRVEVVSRPKVIAMARAAVIDGSKTGKPLPAAVTAGSEADQIIVASATAYLHTQSTELKNNINGLNWDVNLISSRMERALNDLKDLKKSLQKDDEITIAEATRLLHQWDKDVGEAQKGVIDAKTKLAALGFETSKLIQSGADARDLQKLKEYLVKVKEGLTNAESKIKLVVGSTQGLFIKAS